MLGRGAGAAAELWACGAVLASENASKSALWNRDLMHGSTPTPGLLLGLGRSLQAHGDPLAMRSESLFVFC